MNIRVLAQAAGSAFNAARVPWPAVSIGLLVIWLAACAIGPQLIWWKPRFSDEEFAYDAYVCRHQARNAASTLPIPTYADVIRKTKWETSVYAACLEMKGYRKVKGRDGKPLSPFNPSSDGIEVRDHLPQRQPHVTV
jgi:hypothetical protein